MLKKFHRLFFGRFLRDTGEVCVRHNQIERERDRCGVEEFQASLLCHDRSFCPKTSLLLGPIIILATRYLTLSQWLHLVNITLSLCTTILCASPQIREIDAPGSVFYPARRLPPRVLGRLGGRGVSEPGPRLAFPSSSATLRLRSCRPPPAGRFQGTPGVVCGRRALEPGGVNGATEEIRGEAAGAP